MSHEFDVYAVGNALVDTEFQVDDGFLRQHRIEKSQMTLVDDARLKELTRALRELKPSRDAGGSAANTTIAVRGFGGTAFYSCRVARDEEGEHFLQGMRRAGVHTVSNERREGWDDDGAETGRCLVLITPDAERTMSTYLGISERLCVDQLDFDGIRRSKYVYLEGYLASSDTGREAAIAAREHAERSGTHTSLTLSDVSMVTYFREQLERMAGNGVHTLFCNENEALAWCRTDRVDVAALELKDIAQQLVITLGGRGALVQTGRQAREVAGFPVQPLDTNGAGDMFAGAALWALTQGRDLASAARFANFAAARLVTHFGARLPFAQYAQLRDAYPGD